MNKEYIFKSLQNGKIIVIIDNNKITIKRKGLLSFISHGLKGEKTIMINQISAVQLKKAKMTIGYLQLCLIGSQESKSGLQNAMKDENTIVFGGGFNDKQLNINAEEIKNYIEDFNSNEDNSNKKENDKYDKLSKIKKLLDENTITREEFEKEKEKILSK